MAGKVFFSVRWPEEAPFHTQVFVVTHDKRDPWERPGGTTFHFVNDGIEAALDHAREAVICQRPNTGCSPLPLRGFRPRARRDHRRGTGVTMWRGGR